MYVLVTYDVSTKPPAGVKRLRKVAACCLDYGQRVQNSVFEISADPATWVACRDRLLKLIDPSEDSVRFYMLGKNWRRKVEHHGRETSYDIDAPMIV